MLKSIHHKSWSKERVFEVVVWWEEQVLKSTDSVRLQKNMEPSEVRRGLIWRDRSYIEYRIINIWGYLIAKVHCSTKTP